MEEKRVGLSEKEVSGGFDWDKIWEKYKVPVILGLVGLILVGIGVFAVLLLQQKEAAVEILPAEEVGEEATIFVDFEGAVEKPGVYELPADSRINDLLTAAGGLSAEADREWVKKNLNLAQKLVDGVKIYIPKQGERAKEQESEKVAGSSAALSGRININNATASTCDV